MQWFVDSLQNLNSLQFLFLSNNQIKHIDSLNNLTLLYSLDLSDNQIEVIYSLKDMKSLYSLYLSNNQIREVNSLQNLTSLYFLYLTNNKIKDVGSLKNLKSLRYLYLSNNQIKEIDSLQLYKSNRLTWLYLFHNPIENLTFNINSLYESQIYLSTSFNLSVLNDSINNYNQIYVINDLKNVNTSNIFNQKLISKSIKSIKYYRSANLIQLNDMFHSDCHLTIDFMRRRIHFNLFLFEQIDQFFEKCQKLEL